MTFLDIVVVPVRKDALNDYLDHSRTMAPFFRRHGASRVTETWGVDLPSEDGLGYAGALQLGSDETVAIGWITWPDRKTRDAAWMQVKQVNPAGDLKPPFDPRRLLYGGFDVVIDA